MKRNWEIDELIENFTFLPNEMSQIGNKTDENRLGFAVIFKFFQQEARFPITKHEIPKVIIDFIAKQTKTPADLFNTYEFNNRTGKIPQRDKISHRNIFIIFSSIFLF